MPIDYLKRINSILILDDDKASLESVAYFLKSKITANIITTRFPSQAENLANRYFFDIILIDVTMQYKGNPFGGLDLYSKLLPRYGESSLIVYSTRVTDDLLKQYDYNFNFLDKHIDPLVFTTELTNKIVELRRRQTCFIAMPFANKYEPIYTILKVAIKKNCYRTIRVDQENFTDSIIQKILDEIRNAKIIIFLSTDMNPNAFYECGYAVALKKEVITVTDNYSNLPFDIRDRNAISYDNKMEVLQTQIEKRISSITEVPF